MEARVRRSEPLEAVVHSVFRRVVNVCLDAGGFLSLSAQEVSLAPNGVAVELPENITMEVAGVRPGQSVMLDPRTLVVSGSGLTVSLAEASPWEPRPAVHDLPVRELEARARRVRQVTIGEGQPQSLLPLLWTGPDPTRLALAARSGASFLRRGAAHFDQGLVREGASRLAGLGPGLTPSGDDFLAGFTAAWRLSAEALGVPTTGCEDVADAILDGGGRRASELGRCWLEHAGRGEVAEPMGQLFTALLGATPSGLAPRARGVLALGATSGTDWLVGALFGIGAALDARSGARS